ncbi:hypothetical protein WMY93_024311 [Mugilogobius chulae]|uniref:VLIG-type G domain-containing protein n=1 Tax=Mugilogobius chulae TaxID=88201 RepID=A0AAW0N622_9GOBI
MRAIPHLAHPRCRNPPQLCLAAAGYTAQQSRLERRQWARGEWQLLEVDCASVGSGRSAIVNKQGRHGGAARSVMEFIRKQKTEELLSRLHLQERYENKLTSAEFLQLCQTKEHDQDICEADLCSVYLHKLLMLDYRARYMQAKQGRTNGAYENSDMDDLFDIEEEDESKSEQTQIHSMDVQMAVFHCSDSFLQQKMVTKLSQCQNCRGSNKSQLLFEGVAEIAWYCPSGKLNDSFKDCVAFCNLHGDGLTHDKQLNILMEMSSINVVFVPKIDRNNESAKVIKRLQESPKPLIVLIENSGKEFKSKQAEAELKSKQAEAELKSKQAELAKLSNDLQSATCGLEHIFREMAQIYEAHKSLDKPPNSEQTDWSKYPELAAELMISGHPMELMDGDAGHVPLTWISSLIDEVIHKLGDKRVFVLTVLGIQSSGKSTMLNAMFGLQFSVSSGRCTRGAFMQLVELSEEMKKDFKWDYILVVDTEGLRAPELDGNVTIHHDNELATFVVGVGNMTLVNIFGENPNEIQDVLQIVNVSDVSAVEKNMDGKRKLQEKLDKMTQLAATEEVCQADIFSDIIEFDIQKDVKYFAQLWEGTPPMAPPNPGYSESVQDLRKFILSKASKSPGVTLSAFRSKVDDLWNALLNENFVFSFKNTLEIAAYRKLERKASQEFEDRKAAFEKNLFQRSMELAYQLRDQPQADQDLEEQFNNMWDSLACELTQVAQNIKPAENIDLAKDQDRVLYEYGFEKDLIEKEDVYSATLNCLNMETILSMLHRNLRNGDSRRLLTAFHRKTKSKSKTSSQM